MFQLFLRARLHNFIMARLGDDGFRARSPERDAETASLRIGSVVTAIESASNASKKVAVPTTIRVLTCHQDCGSRSSLAMTDWPSVFADIPFM